MASSVKDECQNHAQLHEENTRTMPACSLIIEYAPGNQRRKPAFYAVSVGRTAPIFEPAAFAMRSAFARSV